MMPSAAYLVFHQDMARLEFLWHVRHFGIVGSFTSSSDTGCDFTYLSLAASARICVRSRSRRACTSGKEAKPSFSAAWAASVMLTSCSSNASFCSLVASAAGLPVTACRNVSSVLALIALPLTVTSVGDAFSTAPRRQRRAGGLGRVVCRLRARGGAKRDDGAEQKGGLQVSHR